MKEVKMSEGKCIDYTTTASSIIFGDEDLMLNLKNREMDSTVMIDICEDSNGFLVVGTATGYRYVAQVEIPPREYTEVITPAKENQPDTEADGNTVDRVPVSFNMDKCSIYLFGGVTND